MAYLFYHMKVKNVIIDFLLVIQIIGFQMILEPIIFCITNEISLGSGRFWVNSPWNLYLEKIPWEGEFTQERAADPMSHQIITLLIHCM